MRSISTQQMNTAGSTLKARRKALGKTLQQISDETKIRKDYLASIEADQYDRFNNPVFLSGFLKIYAGALGLDTEKILAIYRRSVKKLEKKEIILEKKQLTPDKTIRDMISPRMFVGAILTLFLVTVLGYIGYQLYNFQKNPVLEISSPDSDITVENETLLVSGKTDDQTRVTVNDKEVKVNSEGEFESEYTLNEGKNLIVIKANRANNQSKETQIIRTVTYAPEQENKPEQQPKPEIVENKVTISVNNQPTWVQIIVDDMQKTGEILQPGFNESYVINKTLSINTGILSNVSLKFNEQDIPLTASFVECEIQENQLTCQ